MEVDFGHLGLTWDVNTRSRRRTWVFSGRLRHSRRAYREVVFDQKQETFFACHMHAFEWFGGVAEKVTPDNLKAAVIVASFEDPLVNRAYRQLALHYGFLISPCLPRHPEHKDYASYCTSCGTLDATLGKRRRWASLRPWILVGASLPGCS